MKIPIKKHGNPVNKKLRVTIRSEKNPKSYTFAIAR